MLHRSQDQPKAFQSTSWQRSPLLRLQYNQGLPDRGKRRSAANDTPSRLPCILGNTAEVADEHKALAAHRVRNTPLTGRKIVVSGKSVSVREEFGWCRGITIKDEQGKT